MLKILTQILKNPSLLHPKIHIKNTSDIRQLILKQPSSQNNKQSQLVNKIKNSKIWIFDKDDTLVPLYSFRVEDKNIMGLLACLLLKADSDNYGKQCISQGQQRIVYVVSNSVKRGGKEVQYVRFQFQGEKYQIQVLQLNNKKPFNGQQILQQLSNRHPHHKLQNITIVGDRLLTDIYLGNIMKWNTIYVDPIQKTTISKHGLPVYIMRKFQKTINYLL